MTDEEVHAKVTAAIKDVPYAIGMNNHMGSKVTSDKRIMSVVLDVCKEHGLFFVDSRTNYWSVVPELAAKRECLRYAIMFFWMMFIPSPM